ncbi:MAG: HIT family hydrolase [Desulfobacterales bacterium SG8_35]|nr:MAG: HIT family hydrolase [Desulfobacterales bacterium SG8_35]
MKNLWTPWRMAYIQEGRPLEKECIFEAGAGKKHEKESLLLYRDSLTVVLLNRFPYANGHILLAPCRHIGDINDLLPEENAALFDLIRESVSILRKHKKPDGFNVGLNLGTVAGAGYPDHLHFHVVPRWEGDHNFMTVLAEVRTIPEHIAETFDQLLPDFQELFSKDK